MSDTREKLIELIAKAKNIYAEDYTDHSEVEYIADMLLDKGMIVQEWVPEKDPPKESGEYIVMIHKAANPTTLMYHAGEKAWFEVTMEDGEELYTYYSVDYWMHLPIPPKGE